MFSRIRFFCRKAYKLGQVTVELLLVLPVFMLMLFFIMEIGNIAFYTIVAHHCAYELARIGSMVAGPSGAHSSAAADIGKANTKIQNALSKMFSNAGQISAVPTIVQTMEDPQSPGHMNEDLEVTLVYPIKLVFPGSSFALADPPRNKGIHKVTVSVRMPIEKPIFK